MIRLYLFKEVAVRLPRKRIQELFKKIMREEIDGDSKGRVNLVFTSNSHLKKLNGLYRNKDKSTDVLSFNIDNPTDADAVFGEIYISVQKAKMQASEYGFELNDEFMRLTCHGLLHLLGYDHVKTADRNKMEARARHYLEQMMVS